MKFNSSKEQFLKNFYGLHFNREIANPIRRSCYNFKSLIHNLKLWEQKHLPAYCTVYDYNKKNLIPKRKPTSSYIYPYMDNVILDKIFFDFDLDYTENEKASINFLETKNEKYDYILSLMEHGRIKKPIEEALKLAKYITGNFDGYPLLVFSGSKGCHLYLFFKEIKLKYPKEVIRLLVKSIESDLNLETVDPSPIGDLSRISRIPTSIHPGTGLYAHPFDIESNYENIINDSQIKTPQFDYFDKKNRKSDINNTLRCIDDKISKKKEYIKYKSIFKRSQLKAYNRPYRHMNKNSSKIIMKKVHDILFLKRYPCFKNAPYDHNLRLILSCLCLWSGFTPYITSEALKLYSRDYGHYDANKHLHDPNNIKNLILNGYPKYVFTCSYMKGQGLCKNCNERFYLKLGLPDEYYNRIKNKRS